MAGWRADKLANCRPERSARLGILHRPTTSLKKFHSVCSMRSDFSIQDHSTIRATFMWDRSIMCLWGLKRQVNTHAMTAIHQGAWKGSRTVEGRMSNPKGYGSRRGLSKQRQQFTGRMWNLILFCTSVQHCTAPSSSPVTIKEHGGYLWNFC